MKKRILILIFMILFVGACDEKKCGDLARIREYALNEQYEDIVENYSGCRWDGMDDPWELIDYITAYERLNKKLPRSLTHESDRVGNFSEGFYLLAKGRFAESFDHLMEIQKSLEDSVWWTVGLLEHARYAGDLERYRAYLENLKWFHDSYLVHVPKRLIPYYQGYYYVKTAAFDKLENLLEEHSEDLHPYEKRELLFKMYIHKNNLELAEEIIEEQISQYPANQHAHDSKALLLYYQHGPKEAVAYLDGILKKFPDMNVLKISYANYLLLAGNRDAGLEILNTLCRKRVCEDISGLYIADLMLKYGEPKKGGEILKKFFSERRYAKLPYLQYMIAKAEYAKNNISAMEGILKDAKAANPYADYIIWFEYSVSMEQHKYDDAEEKLMRLYKLSPNDVDVLFELAKIYYMQDEYEMAEKYETKLRDSIRFVPEEYTKELSAFKIQKKSK